MVVCLRKGEEKGESVWWAICNVAIREVCRALVGSASGDRRWGAMMETVRRDSLSNEMDD